MTPTAKRRPQDLAADLGLAKLHAPGEGHTERLTAQQTARAWRFFGWLAGTLAAVTLIGVLPGLAVAIFFVAWLEFAERPRGAVLLSVTMSLFFWLVFDRIFSTPWPDAVLGDVWPWLRAATGLV